MAFSRYYRDNPRYDYRGLETAGAIEAVRANIAIGRIAINKVLTTTQVDRLDTIAGEIYGDARYWWVLAIASGIGWGMQVPPNTIIQVPNLADVQRVVA
jgi:hypothetical protein